jgi:hypothetical protein
MALVDDVKKALEDAGSVLKADLWTDDDDEFLAARARDLVGLARKAQAATDERKRAAYLAAVRGTVSHVKLLAMIRMEVAQRHVVDALGRFFLEHLLPRLLQLLPALVGL